MPGAQDEDPTLFTPVDLQEPETGGQGGYQRTVAPSQEGTPSGIRAPDERGVPQTVALSSGEHARVTGSHAGLTGDHASAQPAAPSHPGSPPQPMAPPQPGPPPSPEQGGGELVKALALGAVIFVLTAAAAFGLVWALFG